MPGRKTPIVTGHFYHIFNRGVARMPTFTSTKENDHFMNLLDYYRFTDTPKKYSEFKLLSTEDQNNIRLQLRKNNKRVDIHAFVLMPNHFHFILQQLVDGGISSFVSDVVNSYTKYVNTSKDRVGPLFQGRFKAIKIDSDEQFLHLSRYIHLNPYTDKIVNSVPDLLLYKQSSLQDYYYDKSREFIKSDLIKAFFKRKGGYKKFVLSQRDYQRKLKEIERLLHEYPSKF